MIELINLEKRFGDFAAVDGISLQIPKGSAYGLLGSNGAGKSTLLRLITGIYKQDSGEVKIDGEEVFDNISVKEKVFFINDETVQYSGYTLNELKKYFKTFYKSFSEEKWNTLWNVLKLPLDKKLSTFSKGMKRQAVVICGIACQPQYLLLDEAFDGLDPTMRIIVKKMLVDSMVDNGLTIVISSHNLNEIDEFCDTVGLFHKGKLVFNRELDSVKGNIHKVQTSFDGEVTAEDFKDLDLLHFSVKGSIVYMIVRGNSDEIINRINELKPHFCDILPLSLEEIFIYEMEVLGYDYTELDQ